jgi:hypothetical protein
MKKKQPKTDHSDKTEGPRYRVRLPEFINEDIGLGDVIKRVTSAAGIKPCGGCQRRAAALNRWLVFSGRRRQAK